MRSREEITKDFISFDGWKKMAVPDERQRANLANPKLQLEVLLDIRELLLEVKKGLSK